MHDRIRSVLAIKGHTVVTATTTTPLLVAIATMNENHVGAVVVVERGVTIGILTERDVLVRVLADGRDPEILLVGEVMTCDPLTVPSDTTVSRALMLMTAQRCRHLPVVDAGELRGLVSIGDLTNWIVNEQQRRIDDLHDYIRAA